MTGPLAPQFAQLEKALKHFDNSEAVFDGLLNQYDVDLAREALAALSEIERHVQDTETARKLLSECLWDDRAWEPDELVARMEQVYVLIGGDLARAALPAREKGTE